MSGGGGGWYWWWRCPSIGGGGDCSSDSGIGGGIGGIGDGGIVSLFSNCAR